MARLQEVKLRNELNDPDFELAYITLDFESDKYVLGFKCKGSIFEPKLLENDKLQIRKFKLIDSANKVAFDLGYTNVIIDNKLELFK